MLLRMLALFVLATSAATVRADIIVVVKVLDEAGKPYSDAVILVEKDGSWDPVGKPTHTEKDGTCKLTIPNRFVIITALPKDLNHKPNATRPEPNDLVIVIQLHRRLRGNRP